MCKSKLYLKYMNSSMFFKIWKGTKFYHVMLPSAKHLKHKETIQFHKNDWICTIKIWLRTLLFGSYDLVPVEMGGRKEKKKGGRYGGRNGRGQRMKEKRKKEGKGKREKINSDIKCYKESDTLRTDGKWLVGGFSLFNLRVWENLSKELTVKLKLQWQKEA